MNHETATGILQEIGESETFSMIEIRLNSATRAKLEIIATRHGRTLSELVESVLESSRLQPAKDWDDSAAGEEEPFGDEWARLTNEILSLESIRRRVVQLAEKDGSLSTPSQQLLCLMDFPEQK